MERKVKKYESGQFKTVKLINALKFERKNSVLLLKQLEKVQ